MIILLLQDEEEKSKIVEDWPQFNDIAQPQISNRFNVDKV